MEISGCFGTYVLRCVVALFASPVSPLCWLPSTHRVAVYQGQSGKGCDAQSCQLDADHIHIMLLVRSRLTNIHSGQLAREANRKFHLNVAMEDIFVTTSWHFISPWTKTAFLRSVLTGSSCDHQIDFSISVRHAQLCSMETNKYTHTSIHSPYVSNIQTGIYPSINIVWKSPYPR